MTQDTTRERVLSLIVSAGPIKAATLAQHLSLTSAAVRRHLTALIDEGLIHERDVPGKAERGRGRPARAFVATADGQRSLQSAYADVALQALEFIRERGELGAYVDLHGHKVEARYAPAIDAAMPIGLRVEALAQALAAEGYAPSVRPGPGGFTVQLCQGHCPVLEVAQSTPEWCDAETKAFSRLLGVHVQRLSTLAQGAHVCTTTIPLSPAIKEG